MLATVLFLAQYLVASELADLGDGLAYLRVTSATASGHALQSALAGPGPVVIDLRYAADGDDLPAILRPAAGVRPAPGNIFVLVSPATPAAVAEVISQWPKSVITLGPAGSNPAPMVAVKTTAEADRQAYDALAAGTPLATLVSGKIEKERYDEASLVQEFKNGNPDPEPPEPPDPTAAKPAGTTEKPPPLIDRVLQRAVHLHQALLALRR